MLSLKEVPVTQYKEANAADLQKCRNKISSQKQDRKLYNFINAM